MTADASQLNTDNSNVASDLRSKDIVELPLNGRNVFNLIDSRMTKNAIVVRASRSSPV